MLGCVRDIRESESYAPALQHPSENAYTGCVPELPSSQVPLGSVHGTQDLQHLGGERCLHWGPRMPKRASRHCQLHPAVGVTARCLWIIACRSAPNAESHGHSGGKAESPGLGLTLQCRHTLSYRKASLDDKTGTRSSLLPVLSSLPEIKAADQRASAWWGP